VILNPLAAGQHNTKEWSLAKDLSDKPKYSSDQPLVDALFNLSLEEAMMNIEPDSTLRTGAKWGGVWTRDISYSIFLAFAYHEPEIAKISLMKKVKRGRIIQDTGSGGAWPVSSDRTTWSLAAWEIYKVTGDREWLETVYEIIKNTLDDDSKTLPSGQTGMFRGESSFLDWREQTYPKWMSNMDISMSENLGTNVVHYQAHIILAEMAEILGKPNQDFLNTANEIKTGINTYLWMPDKGYYGQYIYGRKYLNLSPRFEALGEALAVLFDVASPEQATSILSKAPLTEFGTTCIFPQIPGIPPYHNNGIWPFVQSYWNLAAAKAGNENALNHGLAAIYRAGGLFLTNYENFVADNGDYVGTEINSDRMLWSMAGNLAMVHRVFMGMSFQKNGIAFNPVIPKAYPGTKTLTNFKYRNAILEITVKGFGNKIERITLDGQPLENAFLPASVTGRHQINIQMADNEFGADGISLVKNAFSLPDPFTQLSGSVISWSKMQDVVSYNIYKNGSLFKNTNKNHLEIDAGESAEYKVCAVDALGAESFTCEPIFISPDSEIQIIEMEKYLNKSVLPFSNFSGKGFVEISTTKNREFTIPIHTQTAGTYWIDCRYANGTGPWNTDNNCAIRSIYINNNYKGVWVFPQRGTNEWSDWGFSNIATVLLNKGDNELKIVFEDWNNNMDIEINEALLDYVRVIREE